MLINRENTYPWYLEGVMPDAKSWVIHISKFPFLIGRNAECNLTLSSTAVSRKHARIFIKGSTPMIQDLKSTNGTFVNHNKIEKDTPLKNGDTIHFGDFKFQIYYKNPMKENYYNKTNLLEKPFENNNFIKNYAISKKEKEVLFYLLDGKATAAIAKILDISPGTAKNHILSIYKKTDTHSKFELLTLFNKYNKNK